MPFSARHSDIRLHAPDSSGPAGAASLCLAGTRPAGSPSASSETRYRAEQNKANSKHEDRSPEPHRTKGEGFLPAHQTAAAALAAGGGFSVAVDARWDHAAQPSGRRDGALHMAGGGSQLPALAAALAPPSARCKASRASPEPPC